MWSKSQLCNSPDVAFRRRHPVLAFALADQGKPLWSGRQMPEAIAWRVCQYKGVSSSPDLPGGTAGRPLADSSLSSFVIRRPRTCRLCGAVGAASTSCRRGSSLTSTSGHYGPRPATTRIAPRRRVEVQVANWLHDTRHSVPAVAVFSGPHPGACGHAVGKPVDNRRRMRKTARFPWIPL